MTREQAIEIVLRTVFGFAEGTERSDAEQIVDALGIGQPEVIQHNADWQRDGSLSPGQPVTVTDEMVERARVAINEIPAQHLAKAAEGHPWAEEHIARAALEAASVTVTDEISLTRDEVECLLPYLRLTMMDHAPEVRSAWRNTPVGRLTSRLEAALGAPSQEKGELLDRLRADLRSALAGKQESG